MQPLLKRDRKIRRGVTVLVLIAASLGLSACKEYFVYQSYTGNIDSGLQPHIYSITWDTDTASATSPLALAGTSDADTPCGVTSDGRVVFTRQSSTDGSYGVYIVNGDGTNLIALRPGNSAVQNRCQTVTSDNYIVYSHQEDATGFNGYDLEMLSADNSGANILSFTEPNMPLFLGVTPDRHGIVRTNGNDGYVRITSWLLGIRAPISLVAVPNDQGLTFLGITANNRIVFSRTGADGAAPTTIYSVKSDGTGLTAISSTSDRNVFCALTSDKARVVFNHRYMLGGRSVGDLYMVNDDGTGLTPLRQPGAYHYNDNCQGITQGNYVVFDRQTTSNDPTQTSGLFSIRADGQGNEILLKAAASANDADQFSLQAVSPSSISNIIAFGNSRYQSGPINYRLYRVDASGSGLAEIEAYTPNKSAITISKYDDVLYAVKNGAGGDLRLVRLQGGLPVILDASAQIAWRQYFFIYY